jgi:rare lipoprotein A
LHRIVAIVDQYWPHQLRIKFEVDGNSNNKRGYRMNGLRKVIFGTGVFTAVLSFSSSLVAASETGIASVYSGERTANGEYARASGLTAAHRTLPFGTMVEVTNIHTGRSVVVRINDRGPFVRGRIIDLTPAGARAIGLSGLAPVKLTVPDGTRRAGRPGRSSEG